MAASAATATAAPSRVSMVARSARGNTGVGNCEGSTPMRAVVSPANATSTVAATTATSDDGIAGCRRGRTSIEMTTTATTASAGHSVAASACITTCAAATSGRCPSGVDSPIAAGICCRKMMIAMPRVKPSMTGHGMKVTARPRPVTPATTTMTPANAVTSATLPTPCWATIGARTTAIAPVGPDT